MLVDEPERREFEAILAGATINAPPLFKGDDFTATDLSSCR
jgi:uncharacterized protein with PIN domain